MPVDKERIKLQKKLSLENKRKRESERKIRELQDSLGVPTIKKMDITDKEPCAKPTKNIDDTKVKKIFEPFPGPQTEFLQADEREVLFAGGRFSGKSAALVIDPLKYVHLKAMRGLILRRTMPELRELITRAKDYYFALFPKNSPRGEVKWNQQEKMFTFPSGATIEFRFCDSIDDIDQFKGQQYTWIGIDEITLYESEEYLDKLLGSLRTTDPNIKTYLRATTNPNGIGCGWVKKRFCDLAPPGKRVVLRYTTPTGEVVEMTRKWINSSYKDNPLIINNPEYVAYLETLPDNLRKMWADGIWGVIEGQAFPDFDNKVHVCEPFNIPPSWTRFRAADWGYQSKAACLWFAVDGDNNIYIYREYETSMEEAPSFARKIILAEQKEYVNYGVIDPGAFVANGANSISPGDMINRELRGQVKQFGKATKGNDSRRAGKYLVHHFLKINPITKQPRMRIFSTCYKLIDQLNSLPTKKNDVEDVDTSVDDHLYDSLRYGLSTRPLQRSSVIPSAGTRNFLGRASGFIPKPVDQTFGY